ncbi:MAG: hypothetical protein QW035_01425 [Candidatus Anstonellales archaeon]
MKIPRTYAKGQVSAEMLLVLVVVVAVVAIVATQLIGSAKETGAKVSNMTEKVIDKAEGSLAVGPGGYCIENSDCQSGICKENRCD